MSAPSSKAAEYATLTYRIFKMLVRAMASALFRVKVNHRERLIEEGPCVVIANHQSFLDPPMIGQIYESDVLFLARSTLWGKGFTGWMMNHCPAIPVNQSRPDPASIMRFIRTVKSGRQVVIFPEGARTPDGEIKEAQPGIGLILSQLQGIPVQPLRIEGAFDCLPIHSKKLRFKRITITVGEPFTVNLDTTGMTRRDAQRAVGAYVMERIKELPIDC